MRVVTVGIAVGWLALVVACHGEHTTADAATEREVSSVANAGDAEEEDNGEARADEERRRQVVLARAALDAGTWDGGELYAAAIRTSVMNEPAWPPDPDAGGVGAASGQAYRLGYLRHGSHTPAYPEPITNEDCPEGWYELLRGGFVCGKYASMDPKAPEVKFAANPPSLDNAMPYHYGYALSDNTPVYRRVLSVTDRQKFEPWLLPPSDDAGVEGGAGADAGGGDDTEGSASDETPNETPAKNRRPPKDAGLIRLSELRGRGVLARRMMRGFFVALDRAFNAAHARWWRTAEGFAIPYDRIALQSWSPDFHGSWVKRGDPANLDGGEVPEGNGTAALVNSAAAVRYAANDRGRMVFGAPIPKWTALELSGDPKTVDGVEFDETTSGFWIRRADVMVANPEPPSDLGEGEKWIDVDLGHQALWAFEGKHPVYGTRISSGRRTAWDPEHDHPTPTGAFRIYEKHVSTTMDGDVAADGPYSIEDVPWVMYFQGSYALHGAFWHNLFGTTRSHGCVNMSPIDAREIFFWTEPRLPEGWHGVFQTEAHPGTRVIIHEPPQPKAPKPR